MTIAALVGHAKDSVTSKYIHTLDTALMMAADTISDYVQGLLEGVEFKQTGYALDLNSRKAALARCLRSASGSDTEEAAEAVAWPIGACAHDRGARGRSFTFHRPCLNRHPHIAGSSPWSQTPSGWLDALTDGAGVQKWPWMLRPGGTTPVSALSAGYRPFISRALTGIVSRAVAISPAEKIFSAVISILH